MPYPALGNQEVFDKGTMLPFGERKAHWRDRTLRIARPSPNGHSFVFLHLV